MTWFWVMAGRALGGLARYWLSGLVTLERVQVLQYGADVKHAPV